MLCPESIAVSVSAVGVALAQGRTADEIAIMSSVFMQLADTLATISAARVLCENTKEQAQIQGQAQSQAQDQAQVETQGKIQEKTQVQTQRKAEPPN